MSDTEKKSTIKKISFRETRKIFLWYWRLTKNSHRYFMATLFLYAVGVILYDVVSVVLYKKLVDGMTASTTLPSVELWYLVALISITMIAQYGAYQLGHLMMARYQVSAIASIADFAVRETQKHSYGFFANHFAGSLISQTKRFIDGLYAISEAIVYTFWMSFISLTGLLIVIFYYSPLIGFIMVGSIIFISLVIIPLLRTRMEADEQEAAANSRFSGYISDIITNILTTKMFPARVHEQHILDEQVAYQASTLQESWRAFNRLSNVQNGLMTFMRIGLIIIGIWLWQKGSITAGTIVLLFTYSQILFMIIWNISKTLSHFLKSLTNAKELIDTFEEIPDIQDEEVAETLHVTEGKIEFSKVSFSYPNGDNVFKNLSFSIAPGEKVGLVGPSGGGKSTITKLLLRFVDTNAGEILIDGQNIKEVTQDSLRAAISYVPQDPTLFHRTLQENIAYARPEASFAEIETAADKAHASEFIVTLEKGYQTEVGERGIKLSGGQRQRVAIARAILKDSRILVLDEATSALDTVSENAIRLALGEMMTDKTVLVIAHRLSTVEKLDRILVLDRKGVIVEQGSHAELIRKNGLYSELWGHQVAGFLTEENEEEA
jgi:ATP-binding cassette subfamily B protein